MQGSGGGPSESNVSGYLIRSTATKWAKNSLLAVDAGTHLSGIVRILEDNTLFSKSTSSKIPSSTSSSIATTEPDIFAFSGAPLPSQAPRTNASFILRELVSTYLITHTHLDHLSGFVINTAALTQETSPKRLAALPHVIDAVKNHIFNDVIWPNLSDENAGVGLVTYQRLSTAADYVSVSEGLSAQAWPVSHGHCMKMHTHWGRKSTAGLDPCDVSRNHSIQNHQARWCVLDSAVFFIRDSATGKEVMMWGDVEPDSVSLDPRNSVVWQEAAQKICMGTLGAIFIECSYDRSHPDNALYGHLSPTHLISELKVLAEHVQNLRAKEQRERVDKLKRKRVSSGYFNGDPAIEERRRSNPNPPDATRFTPPPQDWEYDMTDVSPKAGPKLELPANMPATSTIESLKPLNGVKIVITHVKDTLTDEDVPAKVLADLEELEKETGLGCMFLLARQGSSIYF
ncbi:cyclic-AMP phosphodiesterase [Wilcoxina mikolae CBS 423.85]|nr:cyclic-AMP phosphodiesterase [Wilcoxina mikolae CBS 423.85]